MGTNCAVRNPPEVRSGPKVRVLKLNLRETPKPKGAASQRPLAGYNLVRDEMPAPALST